MKEFPGDARGRELERFSRVWFALFLTACVGTILVTALRSCRVDRLYDDAFIFQRYATRLLSGGGLAWNPGGDPTYGLTSPFFLVVVAPLQWLSGGNVGVAALLASLVPGVVFLALSYKLVATLDERKLSRAALVALAALCMAFTKASDHFISGMETAFALCYATGYLLALRSMERRGDRRSAVVVGVLGGLAFGVRPELVSYTLLVPGLLAVVTRDAAMRRLALRALGITVLLLALHLAINTAYFGSALPLSFYAKSTALYSAEIYKRYRGVSGEHLVVFARSYWPLLVLSIAQLLSLRRRLREPATLIDFGVFGAAVAIAGYHLLFALPVMAYSQRFYYLLLPALIYLAARGLATLVRAAEQEFDVFDARHGAAALCLATALALVWLVPRGVDQSVAVLRQWAKKAYVFDMDRYMATEHTRQWWGLAAFNKLPDDLVMAASEVGLPGAMNPNKVVVDLAGLNERMFAHQPFSAARLFEKYKPDVIYMPHGDYQNIHQQLRKSPQMAAYELVESSRLPRGSLAMAIRRDSRHHAALHKVLTRGLRRQRR